MKFAKNSRSTAVNESVWINDWEWNRSQYVIQNKLRTQLLKQIVMNFWTRTKRTYHGSHPRDICFQFASLDSPADQCEPDKWFCSDECSNLSLGFSLCPISTLIAVCTGWHHILLPLTSPLKFLWVSNARRLQGIFCRVSFWKCFPSPPQVLAVHLV